MLIGMHVEEVLLWRRIVQFVCGKESLYACLFPDACALYVSRRTNGKYEKQHSFSSVLTSHTVTYVAQEQFKPVVRLTAERSTTGKQEICDIFISLYREAPNIRIETTNTSRDLFPRYVEKRPKRNICKVDETTLKSLVSNKARLVKEIEGVDKQLADELNQDTIMQLCAVIAGKKVRPKLVSTVPLRVSLFARDCLQEFNSFNTLYEHGIRLFLEAKIREEAVVRKKERIRTMERKRQRIQKKLLRTEEIDAYRIAGELLLSNVRDIKKGARSVQLPNPYDGTMTAILLDPHMSVQENAQNYFRKYKKHKRGQPVIQKKLSQLEQEIQRLRESEPEEEIAGSSQRVTKREKPFPFRAFTLPSGAVVYVGKSARSNDELTFTFAQPHDYFFHTRGFEGAHTILRAKVPRGQKPSRSDIETAAAIAAYYSKARRQHNVVVSYTQRKYLKKSRKGGLGSVILLREETLFVDPGLPE
jgi:predicted ribosome quality control (RQC) complex YloA/Tae2 family protein